MSEQNGEIKEEKDKGGPGPNSLRRLFWDKRFFHYTWVGLLISALNVFLLWLLIDVLGIPTVISGILVVGVTFVFRYLLLITYKIF